MMDCTDRHDRFFLRLMSKNVMLYSEMVATKSAIHGDRNKILSYSPEEKFRAQGLNDFMVFSTQAFGAISAGFFLNLFGCCVIISKNV